MSATPIWCSITSRQWIVNHGNRIDARNRPCRRHAPLRWAGSARDGAGRLPIAPIPGIPPRPAPRRPGSARGRAMTGQVPPVTSQSIACGLWPAALLAEGFRQGDPQAHERIWRQDYEDSLAVASAFPADRRKELSRWGGGPSLVPYWAGCITTTSGVQIRDRQVPELRSGWEYAASTVLPTGAGRTLRAA